MPILKNNKFLIFLLVIFSFLSISVVLSAGKDIFFLTGLNDRAFFAGKVGIGTTAPRAGLDVASSSIFSGGAIFSALGGQGSGAIVVADNIGTLSSVPKNLLSINVPAGNIIAGTFASNQGLGSGANFYFTGSVGIGTTNLGGKLEVSGDIALSNGSNKSILIPNINGDTLNAPSLIIKASSNVYFCFSGDTAITTPSGTTEISSLKVGDTVISYDTDKKITTEVKVIDIFARTVPEYYILKIGSKTIRTTAEHPFYTKRGWVTVKDLSLNDELFNGESWVKLTNRTIVKDSLLVYNLHVDNPHTFFAAGILVHNKIGGGSGGNLYLSGGLGQGEAVNGNVLLAATSGNVGIGTTTFGAYKLNVEGTSHFSGKVGIATSTGAYPLSVGGAVQASAYFYYSDFNLKDNIKPIDNALAKVLQLQGVSFKWKDNGEVGLGFIAQDVEKVFPEVIGKGEPKSVEYGSLVAPLIEAVKEQQKKIAELEARLKILENK